ncbi:Ge1-WD40 domain-containing protein [Aphelenchoides besseyi]|nr:Ge1-WD40 domain-containing protein [Aphelenchoides besseyi]
MSVHTSSELMEKHQLNKDGKVVSFTAGRNVVLQPSIEESTRDSALTHSRALCDYKWEHKTNYDGRILSASGRLIAYRLFNEKTGEAVRVMELESRARHLIKDFRARVVDLAWAPHAPLLAVLDAKGNLYVYQVDEQKNYALSKYMNILRNVETNDETPRLIWCPYIENDQKDENSGPCHLLAVILGCNVKFFYLNVIKEKFGLPEVDIKSLENDPSTFNGFETESPVTTLRISPDATACAVATTDGKVTFYVIESEVSRPAHNMIPLPNTHVEEMFFLDNVTRRKRDIHDVSVDPLWKHVIFVSDNGRRLEIYNSYTGEPTAKLRFEMDSDASRLEIVLDDTARYLYAINYDTSDLFCIELTPDFSAQPYFVGCTQIFFSSKLICLTPCVLEERIDSGEADELSFDDDITTIKKNAITFVAINNRSLLEVNVDLHRVLDIDLDVSPEVGNRLLQEKLTQQNRNFKASNQRIASSLGSASDLQESPRVKEKVFSPDGNSKRRSRMDGEIHNNSVGIIENNGSDYASQGLTNTDVRKLLQTVAELQEQGRENEKRMAEVNIQLEKINKGHQDLRREQTDNLADVLEKISNEINARDEKIEKVINRMNENLRKDVKKVVEATLNDNAFSLQSTMELSNTRVVETVKTVLTGVLVPSVDAICRQLFSQLNESFRDGLQEFLDQVREELATAPPAPPDYQIRTQVMDNGHIATFTHVMPNSRRIGDHHAGSSLESVKKS